MIDKIRDIATIYLNSFLYDGKSLAKAVLAVSSIIIGPSTTSEIG